VLAVYCGERGVVVVGGCRRERESGLALFWYRMEKGSLLILKLGTSKGVRLP